MGKRFEFRDNRLKLDIDGNIFEIDTTDPELVGRVHEFTVGAQEMASKLSQKEHYAEALKEAIQFCLDTIDSILGEGSSNKIFAGRKVSFFDCLDVIEYITTEINADRESRFQKYSPNRAARRTAKK